MYPAVRRRVLQYVAGMLPRPRGPFLLELRYEPVGTVQLDGTLRRTIATWEEGKAQQEATVEGRLVALQIVPRPHFRVQSVDDGRLIEAEFSEGLEPVLIAHMGQVVRVTGAASLDRRGRVVKLADVTSVQPVDIQYLHVQRVSAGNVNLRFIKPLIAIKTEEEGIVVIRVPELGIHEFGETFEEALSALNDTLAVLWEEYAEAADETLTQDALDLKERLRSIAQLVPQ